MNPNSSIQADLPAGQAGAPALSATRPEVHWLVKLFASGLYSGFSPIASGTIGSVVGLALYYSIPGFEALWVILPAIVVTFFLGVKASALMEKRYGHDPAEVTIDEVVGMWIALLLLPKDLVAISLAFFIFRIFDIVKPYPARKFDNLHGGLGIMLDDVVAGVYTVIAVHLLVHLLHAFTGIE
ncbi:MAG: phosphatidylglycerophosphatase A [Ignavibacteriae bacterium]|nr:phosphatidylglycerophosphatase A [Ignavibacteriota bacterium]